MRTKFNIFGEALRIRVKEFKHNFPKNHLKSTKIAITSCKFSKIIRGNMPRYPLVSILFLNQLQISFAEKIRLTENVEIMPPPLLLKIFATPLPVWVVGKENLASGFRPLHFRNASAIAERSSQETSQWQRAVGYTVSDLTGLGIEPQTFRIDSDILTLHYNRQVC